MNTLFSGDIQVVEKLNMINQVPASEEGMMNHTEDDTEIGVSSDPTDQQEQIISAKHEIPTSSMPDDSEILDDNESGYVQYAEMNDMELEEEPNQRAEEQVKISKKKKCNAQSYDCFSKIMNFIIFTGRK